MLIELLRKVADRSPEQPVVSDPAGSITYAECADLSEELARGVAGRGIERFGIAVDAPRDVLLLLAAASAIGSEACVYPRDVDAEGVDALAARLDHPAVITDGGSALRAAEAIPMSSLPASDGETPPTPDRAPVMILTTGTTGEQKGTRHEWSRLVQAVRQPGDRSGARWLLAYNLNQFAGIQVMLYALASGSTLVVPPSSRAPDAIETMRKEQVTHVSATPTFWRILAGGLDAETAAELPLEQITLGGEPAPDDLIKRLRGLFGKTPISHVYAGTEFGSVVSVRDGRGGLPLSVLDRSDDADVQLRIVDGELQIRSRVGMLGYHDSDDTGAGWLKTGDLVEVREDRIHFVGRTTEIINVGGAKIHPLPIEELVCSVEGVRLAAAYGRPNPVTGQIVAVDVVAVPDTDLESVEAEIKRACEQLPRPGRPRRIRFVEGLELRGQKLVRQGEESR